MLVPRAAASPRAFPPRRFAAAASALLLANLALTACDAGAEYPQTTFRPVSIFGEQLNSVFYNTVAWTMGILVLVVALVLFAAFRFRERPGGPRPAQIHGNTRLEIAWTIVPAVIVVFIAVPTVATIFNTQRRPPADALVVEVIGHQWWWEFRYPEQQITTANLLYLPVDRPISLVMQSADVIHSFWIPKIGGKRDVNPLPRRRDGVEAADANYLTFTVREPGHFTGQCAEYCGEAHGIMRMSVMAVAAPEFDTWVQRMRGQQAPLPAPAADAPVGPTQLDSAAPAATGATPQATQAAAAAAVPTPTAPPQQRIGQMPAPTGAGNPFRTAMPDSVLQAEGRRIFLASPCVACHAVNGTSAVGAIGPNLTLFGTRPLIAAGALGNNRENLVRWIRDPQAVKPGALMPGTARGAGGMAATGLTDAEVRAVAAYLASLK